MIRSRYNLVHALAATAVLMFVIFAQGFTAFWTQFIHGINLDLNPTALLQTFAVTGALFGTLCLVLWLSTLFAKPHLKAPNDLHDLTNPNDLNDLNDSKHLNDLNDSKHLSDLNDSKHLKHPNDLKHLKYAIALAARWSPLIIAIALGLNWLCSAGIELLTGVQPSDQELVKCFAGDSCPLGIRIVLGLLVLFEAPLLEEPLFRGIIFRGLQSSIPTWAAMAVSGFLFAIVHVNAASFIALWFLGIAFAELYRRTGTLLAPMTAHALFNATNLALLPFLSP